MADLFATGIQIPNLESGQARDADYPGFLRVFLRNNSLYGVNSEGVEVPIYSSTPVVTTQLRVDGGSSSTVFTNYLLRLDFGANGSTINVTGEP